MKIKPLSIMVLALGLVTSSTHAEETAMSVSDVLKHTPEDLAQKLGNSSEAGEDHAARLWAAAKRIETDSKLGKSSVQAVQRLNEWRQVLNKWADLKLQVQGIESGGGTMWSHLSARNDAWIEDFLSKHITLLSAEPAEKGKEFNSDYLKTLNAILDAGTKEWKDNEYMQKQAVVVKEELKNTYFHLKYMIQTLPDGETKNAVIKMVKPVSN
ncbi:hypothetical protein NT6N_26140 [Oceaniferula spumae]|uniref:DUF3347 domain-containing protein n=1 Tax=Oceaniferula spumae TaxID=2979115 RepID=A0AAT9FNQ1_9BACT